MKELVDDPPKFNRRIIRIDELRTLVRQDDLIFRMVSDVSQLAELRRFAADAKLTAADDKGAELARRQLARDVEFVKGMVDGCRAIEEIFQSCLDRFDQTIDSHQRIIEKTQP